MRKINFTSSYIRRHLNRLPPNTIISSKDFLQYGTRTAIDKALSRLVISGHVIRLTRGLFRREGYEIHLPDPSYIAKHKAKAFNKMVIALSQGTDSAASINNAEVQFATNGRSSSFHYGNTVIKLKGISPNQFEQLKP